MSRNKLFAGGRIVDPSRDFDSVGYVYCEGDKIVWCGKRLDRSVLKPNTDEIDCSNRVLCPGLVDMRVFGGEPGAEHRETISSLSLAAASGGVTSLLMMPDTHPVIDDVSLVEFVRRASRDALVSIYPCAAITRDLAGDELTEIGLLGKAGAIAFSDGMHSIRSAQMQRRALTYAKDFGALIIAFAQESSLAGSGVMSSGAMATRLGLPGIPSEAEVIPLERDMRLVSMTGGSYHAATLSASASLEVISQAKSRGLDVTAGVAVANLTLNDHDIGSYRTFFRLSPPLRSESDRLALVEGVRDGTIDVICSNHDPQDADTKRHPFSEAADGAVGLESLLAATLRLHHNDGIPLLRLIDCLSTSPARRLGLPCGTLEPGSPADLLIFDLNEPWVLHEDDLHSRSKNTTFEQATFQGRVVSTYVSGKQVFGRRS